jgi:hypothetical protein
MCISYCMTWSVFMDCLLGWCKVDDLHDNMSASWYGEGGEYICRQIKSATLPLIEDAKS